MTSLAFKTVYVAESSVSAGALAELSRVRLLVDVLEGDVRVPHGATGTIVLIHRDRDAYEVEFTVPLHAVVGVARHEIEPAV